MSKNNSGVIIGHRGITPKTQKPKEYLIQFSDVKSVSEAAQLIGRKVAWSLGERKCIGKIVSLHGKNGLVRARFRKGVPGQALGTLVEIIG
jgi:large subunit ribosomal protein L35Ae